MGEDDRRLDIRCECCVLDDTQRPLYNTVLVWAVGVSELLLGAKLLTHFSEFPIEELPPVVRSYNRNLGGYAVRARVSRKLSKSVP